MPYEFSVVWKREGWAQRRKVYQTRRPAEAKAMIVQGRVAEATGWDPDQDYDGARTFRQRDAEKSAEFPPLEYVRVERREVGSWKEIGNILEQMCDGEANRKLIDEDHCDECWEAWIEGTAPPHPKANAQIGGSAT